MQKCLARVKPATIGVFRGKQLSFPGTNT